MRVAAPGVTIWDVPRATRSLLSRIRTVLAPIDIGGDPITFVTLARIHERRGNRDDAVVDYRKAIEQKSADTVNANAQAQARERLVALGALPAGG
jgi:hypothetical protein